MAACRMIIVDPSVSKRAKRIPDETWVRQRDTIERLWLVEGRPMQELVRIMSLDHNFLARSVSKFLFSKCNKDPRYPPQVNVQSSDNDCSEPQYRMKFKEWGFSKNASARAKCSSASEAHKNMQQGGFSNQTPTLSHQARSIDLDSNESFDPAGNQTAGLRSQIYLEPLSSSQLQVVSLAETNNTQSTLRFGAISDDSTLPAIEDEAWKQIEKDIIDCEHIEMMDPDSDASVPSHCVSTSAPQGSVDFKSTVLGAGLKGGSGSAMLEAPLPSVLASLAQDAPMAALNATHSLKTVGQDRAWGYPVTHTMNSSVNQSELRALDPDSIPRQELSALGDTFQATDFDELVSHATETSQEARDKELPFGCLDKQTLGTTSESTARDENIHVHGDGLSLQALDLRRTEQHLKEPSYRPIRLGAPVVARWICHLCHARNNAALSDERYICCAHEPCTYCSETTVRRAAKP